MANPVSRIVGGAQQIAQFKEDKRLSPLRQQSAELDIQGRELGIDAQEAQNKSFLDRVGRSDMARAAAEFLAIPETDIAGQDAFINRRVADLNAQGVDSQDTAGMLALDPATRRQAAESTLQIAQQFGDIQQGTRAPARQSSTDILGRRRFVDTGELTFPDVETPEAPTPQQKFQQEEDRIQLAQSEAKRIGGKFSAASEAALIESQEAAQKSDAAVSELQSIAQEFDRLDPETATGVKGRAREFLRRFLGTEDDVTILRKRYNQIKNNQVMQNLPPGVASDKDIEIAMSGFLSDTADRESTAKFLRGLAKMEKINGQFHAFRSEFISENNNTRGMFKAWKDQLNADNPSLESLTIEQLDNLTVEQLQNLREANQ